VIVDANKGYVLTNHHVIANATEVMVTLKDRRRFKATLVGSDRGTDIALSAIPMRSRWAIS
jgi:serine protease DegQ